MEKMVDLVKKLCAEDSECILLFGIKLNANRGCKAAVTTRGIIDRLRFKICGELLLENRFLLKMKDQFCRSCVRPTILYGSEA